MGWCRGRKPQYEATLCKHIRKRNVSHLDMSTYEKEKGVVHFGSRGQPYDEWVEVNCTSRVVNFLLGRDQTWHNHKVGILLMDTITVCEDQGIITISKGSFYSQCLIFLQLHLL